MNAADIIADRLVTRGIYLERYKSGFNNRILAEIEKLEDDLTRELASSFSKGIPNASVRVRRLENLLGQARQIIKSTYAGNAKLAGKELLRLAANEQTYVVDAVNETAGIELANRTLNYDELKRLTDGTLIEGAKSADWWSRQSDDLQKRFGDQMRMGVTRGETLDQLVARVRGTQARAYQDGIMTASRRQAEAIVHTSVQTIANETRLASYEANADIINALQWVATLDSRTTQICMALNGKMWTTRDKRPIGHDKQWPGPTAHWRCRSTQVPVLKKWEDLVASQDKAALDEEFRKQLREQGFDDDAIASIQRNTRASLDGQVAKDISFDEWLAQKSPEFQDEMLGRGRGKLFRDGKITLTDLIDQSGRPLTITELESLPQPRPGPEPVKLPTLRPKRAIRDRQAPPSAPAPDEAPLVSFATETPRSSPVSRALTIPPDAERAPSYEATLRVIDSIHDDGKLPVIPFIENRATVNIGGYAWRGFTGESIDLTISRVGPHPELTLLHEVGHLLDHQALHIRGQYASEKSPLLEVWRRIVQATPTAKKLRLAAAGKKIDGRWPSDGPSEFARLLPLREMWARAYTQYVVMHAGNPALRAQFDLAARRLMRLYFWPADEFESIDLAITSLLQSKQWQPQP